MHLRSQTGQCSFGRIVKNRLFIRNYVERPYGRTSKQFSARSEFWHRRFQDHEAIKFRNRIPESFCLSTGRQSTLWTAFSTWCVAVCSHITAIALYSMRKDGPGRMHPQPPYISDSQSLFVKNFMRIIRAARSVTQFLILTIMLTFLEKLRTTPYQISFFCLDIDHMLLLWLILFR